MSNCRWKRRDKAEGEDEEGGARRGGKHGTNRLSNTQAGVAHGAHELPHPENAEFNIFVPYLFISHLSRPHNNTHFQFWLRLCSCDASGQSLHRLSLGLKHPRSGEQDRQKTHLKCAYTSTLLQEESGEVTALFSSSRIISSLYCFLCFVVFLSLISYHYHHEHTIPALSRED